MSAVPGGAPPNSRSGRGRGDAMAKRADPRPRDVARRLLAFYDRVARSLPWRRDADPYRVWVSEVMLQQTRVETVIPYYERWLRRFPTLEALAAADTDEVMKAWEGLGYYARARNLHAAARLVRERHAGALPCDPTALRALPGFGDYTVGAVASIAFGAPLPAVDGNVRRVLCRLFDLPDPTPATLRERASALVPRQRPGDFNQALMELGATVCTPRPRCDACPLEDVCAARARGTQLERPARKRARAVPELDVAVALIRDVRGRVLLVKRPAGGLLGGLWSLPAAEMNAGQEARAVASRVARAWCEVADTATALPPVPHAFTHLRIRYHPFCFAVTAVKPPPGDTETVWSDSCGLRERALPVAQRKILRAAGADVACAVSDA